MLSTDSGIGLTEQEVQELIDAAIRKHNRNASIVSMFLGWILLALFIDGLLRLLGIVPRFMGIDINTIPELVDQFKASITNQLY